MAGQRPFSLKQRLRSFACAGRGFRDMLRSHHNARVHAVATLVVIVAGMLFRLSLSEWCMITMAIMAVWVAEALNTACEYLIDLASPSMHPIAGKAKDTAAAAVLIAAIGATIVGAMVFGPHVLQLVSRAVPGDLEQG
jgi:diacylglycerol kinase